MINNIKAGEYMYETLECDKQYNSDYSKDLRDLLRKKKEILKKEIEEMRNDYIFSPSPRIYKIKVHQISTLIIKWIGIKINFNNLDDEYITHIAFKSDMIKNLKNELEDRSYYENEIRYYFTKRRINKLIETIEEEIIELFYDYACLVK